MTDSTTIVNVVNRFGHCVSNEKVKNIDSGVETSIAHTTKLVLATLEKIQKHALV